MPILALDVKTVKLITTTQVITSVYTAVKELIENALDANADNIEINLVCNKFIFNIFIKYISKKWIIIYGCLLYAFR